MSRAERRRKARELREVPQRGEFALVWDDEAGPLPVDKYRAHFVNVPAHFSERYSLVRFFFPVMGRVVKGFFPEKAPASWVREVSDPLELGAVWFFEESEGSRLCAEYRAECSHLAAADDDDWRWCLCALYDAAMRALYTDRESPVGAEIVAEGMHVAEQPIIAITMGDPCGIGAEVIAKALARPEVAAWCTPLVVGNVDIMRRAVELTGRS